MQIFHLIIALVFCITIHEAAHAWVAYKLGDPTAKLAGRVTLNPLRHLDLVGTLMIFLVHFGWGKPVPYDDRHLKYPRRDAALIAAAGPISNLISAILIVLALKYFPARLPSQLISLLTSIYQLSIVLFLFNLLPITPLDGSKILALAIPRSMQEAYDKYLMKGPFYLVVLIIADRLLIEVIQFSPLSTIIKYGFDFMTALIYLAT